MKDTLYKSGDVLPPFDALFEQAALAFPAFEVWHRTANFGRYLGLAIVRRETGAAVLVPLWHGSFKHPPSLAATELDRIRNHLSSNAQEDLTL